MKVNVLMFATLKDLVGQGKLSLELPDVESTVQTVRAQLIELHPHADAHFKIALVAINEDFAFDSDAVHDGDKVAFFPPVSGGSDTETDKPEFYSLPDAPIDHNALIARITTPATGAVCLFSGIVRGETQKDGHIPQTAYLHYEAYEEMALAKMRQVAAEIRERWALVQGIAIVQRIGQLAVGENTVLIACSSGHRDQGCFEAARYGIDRLKEIVPVWKKEVGPHGEQWVEGDYRPSQADRAKE